MRGGYVLSATGLFVLSVLVGSCKKDDSMSPPTAPMLTVGQTSFNLHPGDAPSTTISGGTPPYVFVNKGDTTKVAPSISGSLLTIHALGAGSSTIIVGDNSSPALTQNINVVVTIPPLAIGRVSFDLHVGDSGSTTVSGGTPPYVLVNKGDTTKVLTTLSGSSLTVHVIAAGSTTIVVGDNSTPAMTGSIAVTVPLTTSAPAVTLSGTTPQNVTISTGIPPYVISQPPSASLATAHFVDVNVDTAVLVITGVSTATGSTSVVVKDASNPQRSVAVAITKIQ